MQKYVKEKGRITNKEYREICQTSERTATRDLTRLVELKVFEQIGITGKGTEYMLRRHKDANDATKAPIIFRRGLMGSLFIDMELRSIETGQECSGYSVFCDE